MATDTQRPRATAADAGEILDPLYVKIRDLVYQISGIYHSQDKLYLLNRACTRRMSAIPTKELRDYFALLCTSSSRDAELRQLLNEITIGETCLFRSQPQLDALRNIILPQMIEGKGKIGVPRLRVWSAGCSTGEEPYTLAMFLLEEIEKQLKGWTLEINATDLNDRSVETAKAGVYGSYAIRNTPELFKRKYFISMDDKLKVADNVKACVKFSRMNLSDDSKMVFMKGMDLIFCCNVLIYFDKVSKKKVVQHFYANLVPGGYFFLGLSESLFQVSDQFQLVHFPGSTGYRKPLVEKPVGATQ